jgi:hypothetical protein
MNRKATSTKNVYKKVIMLPNERVRRTEEINDGLIHAFTAEILIYLICIYRRLLI